MVEDYEYGRYLLLESFKSFIQKIQLSNDLNVTIVGGSKKEPELIALRELGYNIKLELYGIEYYLSLIHI